MPVEYLRRLLWRAQPLRCLRTPHSCAPPRRSMPVRTFTSSNPVRATLMQVMRGCRKPQPARKKVSPSLAFRPEMKGVCLKVGTTRPKKPNSGERKVARVRLSTGKVITASISGEGIAVLSRHELCYTRNLLTNYEQVTMSSSIRWFWYAVAELKIVLVSSITWSEER